jgi:hypothetical protein
MAIKTLRVFQEFTSEGYVPMPPLGNIDYGVTVANTFPATTPATFQLDDPDIDVTVTEMTDFYVWIRAHGTSWNASYTRNVRVYPDSPLINNVVMGIIIANMENGMPVGGTAGQILSKIDAVDFHAQWIDNVADWTSQIKHEVKAGEVLTKGQAVYVSSSNGTNMIVSKASNLAENTSSKTMGLIAQNLAVNGKGFIIAEGLITGVDTSSATSGDPVWLGTSGNLIYGLTNKPVAPAHLVFIGIVTRSNANNGEIFVKVQNGFEIEELHNVLITSKANKDVIVYDSATQLWKNKNFFHTQGYLPYYDNTSLMLDSPFWTNGSIIGLGTTSPSALLHLKGTTAYTNIILDNNSPTGGGMFSAYQNGLETAMFGADAHYQTNTSIDAAIIAKKTGGGIQFYTNGSNSEKMGINSDGNVFVGQTPTWTTSATNLIVRGKTGAGHIGVMHYDMSIKGFMNTFNSIFQIGTSTFHSLAFLVENSERGRVNSLGRLLWGTTTDNGTDLVQINGSLIASSIKKSGGTSTQYLMADGSVSTGSSLTATSPLSITSGVVSITQSNATTNGYLSSTDWATFNAKQTALSGTGFVKVAGSTISYDNSTYTPTSRLLTINGTAYDLSVDRSWTITPGSGMRNIQTFTATASQTTFTITGGYTVGLADVYVNGARLSSSDFTATNGTTIVLGTGAVVNDIVDVVTYTASLSSGINGSGTTNYVPKFSSSNVLANSLIFDNGTNVGIGTPSPGYKLDVSGTARFTGITNIGGAYNTYNGDYKIQVGTETGNQGIIIRTGTTSIGKLSFDCGTNGDGVGKIWYDFSTNSMQFYTSTNGTNSLERIRINSSGSVGIGNTSPTTALDVTGVVTATSFTGPGTVVYSNSSTTVNSGNGQFTPIPASTLTAGVTYNISFQLTAGGRTIAGSFNWRIITGATQAYSPTNTTQIMLSENLNAMGASVFGDGSGAITIQTVGMDLANAPSWSVEVRKI